MELFGTSTQPEKTKASYVSKEIHSDVSSSNLGRHKILYFVDRASRNDSW